MSAAAAVIIPSRDTLTQEVKQTSEVLSRANFGPHSKTAVLTDLAKYENRLNDPKTIEKIACGSPEEAARNNALQHIKELKGQSAGHVVEVPPKFLETSAAIDSVHKFLQQLKSAAETGEAALLRFKFRPRGTEIAKLNLIKAALIDPPTGSFIELLDRIGQIEDLTDANRNLINNIKTQESGATRKASTAHEFSARDKAGDPTRHTTAIDANNKELYGDDGLVEKLPKLLRDGQKVVATLQFAPGTVPEAIAESVSSLKSALLKKLGDAPHLMAAFEKQFEIWVDRGQERDTASAESVKIERITGWHMLDNFQSEIAQKMWGKLSEELLKLGDFWGAINAAKHQELSQAAKDIEGKLVPKHTEDDETSVASARTAADLRIHRESMLDMVKSVDEIAIRLTKRGVNDEFQPAGAP